VNVNSSLGPTEFFSPPFSLGGRTISIMAENDNRIVLRNQRSGFFFMDWSTWIYSPSLHTEGRK